MNLLDAKSPRTQAPRKGKKEQRSGRSSTSSGDIESNEEAGLGVIMRGAIKKRIRGEGVWRPGRGEKRSVVTGGRLSESLEPPIRTPSSRGKKAGGPREEG